MKNIAIPAILLIILGLVVSYFINKQNIDISTIASLSKDKNFNENRLKASHELRFLEFKSQLSAINPDIMYREVTGKAIKASSIYADGIKLVFCIPESVCNPCHENTLKQLNEISSIIDTKSIIVLVDNSKLRSTYVEFNERKNNIKLLGVNFKELAFDIHYVPFFFILKSDSRCENLFIPNSFDPELTINYINVVKKKYFQT